MATPKNEQNIHHLLKRTLHTLTRPVAENQRRLLLVVNITYLLLATEFIFSEWFSSGQAVPDKTLWYVYILVGITNTVSAVYTYVNMSPTQARKILGVTIGFKTNNLYEKRLRWMSLITIMIMSFCFMVGIGNPSSDSLLTDFALGHSLIVLIAMLLGREASFAWFLIVLIILVYTSFFQKSYSYQYNYLTRIESSRYETALRQGKSWAVKRRELLKVNHLNPPKVSRYFNIWFIFILVAYLSAYYFTDSARKVNDTLPVVEQDMKIALEEAHRQELQQMRDDEERLLLRQDALDAELKNLKAQINPHFLFNTLNYFYMKSLEYSDDLANSILMLSDIMQYSVRDSIDRVDLDEEIKNMEQFVELVQLRNNHKLCIDFSVKGPINQVQILPFLLIGLLENAFKHGNMLNPSKPLVVTIDVTPPHLAFFICNQKNLKKRVKSTQIGLANTHRRLDLTYRKFTFNIDQDEESFCIKLLLDTNDFKEGYLSHTTS